MGKTIELMDRIIDIENAISGLNGRITNVEQLLIKNNLIVEKDNFVANDCNESDNIKDTMANLKSMIKDVATACLEMDIDKLVDKINSECNCKTRDCWAKWVPSDIQDCPYHAKEYCSAGRGGYPDRFCDNCERYTRLFTLIKE